MKKKAVILGLSILMILGSITFIISGDRVTCAQIGCDGFAFCNQGIKAGGICGWSDCEGGGAMYCPWPEN